MPSEEIIIADSSPLIGLARIGQLELLPQLARRIVVPRAVHEEVTSVRTDAPGAAEIAAQSWIEVLDAEPSAVAPLLILLGRGEAEAIALAQREPSAVLLFDDLRARKVAARLACDEWELRHCLAARNAKDSFPNSSHLSMPSLPAEYTFLNG